MVSLASSLVYTRLALESFFKHTELLPEDQFILIDNDGSARPSGFDKIYPRLTYFQPKRVQSFSENANVILAAANDRNADAYFMNNDVVFSPHWLRPLETNYRGIVTPTSNQNVSYRSGSFQLKPVMSLSEYQGNEEAFLEICKQNFLQNAPMTSAYKTNFFLVKIPPLVYRSIGGFDTAFSPGGGEDDDYAVRVHLAGLGVFVNPNSLILHFGGRSSWSGPETREEWIQREVRFIEVFEHKWGKILSRFLLRRDRSVLDTRPDWQNLEATHGIGSLFRSMAEEGGASITPEKCILPFQNSALGSDAFATKSSQNAQAKYLYLDLMKKCLTNTVYGDSSIVNIAYGDMRNLEQHFRPFDRSLRADGRDWPALGHTMIGLKRLNNIQFCAEDVIQNHIPGDFIETGVWRGGATIFMRAILKAHEVNDRSVWVCDSFEGVPPPNSEKYPADAGLFYNQMKGLAVSLEEVRENFKRYDLLDSQVHFIKGWFRDTLPRLPVQKISLLRLDGDLYESTMDALTNLYPKLSPGGYCIIDDYLDVMACREAVEDYRRQNSISETIHPVDWTAVYWKKLV
jgi:GT2 family glycosyltransferase